LDNEGKGVRWGVGINNYIRNKLVGNQAKQGGGVIPPLRVHEIHRLAKGGVEYPNIVNINGLIGGLIHTKAPV